MNTELETPLPVLPEPPRARVYQIRTPGSHDWLELDREAYDRMRGVRVFDRRVLVIEDESIVG
jgi:hypothetical protein